MYQLNSYKFGNLKLYFASRASRELTFIFKNMHINSNKNNSPLWALWDTHY